MGKTIKFHIEHETKGNAYAIISAEKNYRLCWLLNRVLGLNLSKIADHIVYDAKGHASHFSLYLFNNEEDAIQYYVLKNKAEDKLLLPEFKQADYILLIKGELWQLNEEEILNKLNTIQQIQWFTAVDLSKIKSSQNFIIDA